MPPKRSVDKELERAEAMIRRAVALLDDAERILEETDERLHQALVAAKGADYSINLIRLTV